MRCSHYLQASRAWRPSTGASDCGIERMGRGLGAGGGGKTTRVTQFNPKLFELNEVQRGMAPDHDESFSVPFPDFILDSSPLQATQCIGAGMGISTILERLD